MMMPRPAQPTPGGRPARLDAIDAAKALEHSVVRVDPALLGEQVEDGRNVLASAQSVGGIRLGVAAELHDLEAGLG